MKILRFLAFSLLLLFGASKAFAQTSPKQQTLSQHVYDSVVLLYTQDGAGDMRMVCTATAFAEKPELPAKQNGKELATTGKFVYRFVSAAHCVDGNDDKQQKLQKFYVTSDSNGEKSYISAKLIQAGDKKQGDDFSLFEVTTADKFVVTPLGDETVMHPGDGVVNVAGAMGFGKQYFQGYVSEVHMDRPPLNAGVVLWTDLMLVEIGGGPGSSGSAIVSTDQSAIVGFLVGDAGVDVGKLCVPVSKFKTFLSLVDAGKYKKTPTLPDNPNTIDDQSYQQ